MLKKSAKGAVFDDFWEVSQKSDRKPPLKTLAFWTRCGVYAPFERAKKSYFNNLLGQLLAASSFVLSLSFLSYCSLRSGIVLLPTW